MIHIVDYGLGNISAFANIYKRLNIPFRVASSTADFTDVTRLILPGVGAFDHAMKQLNKSGMRETVDELVLSRKIPVLGICVGMQMMARSSEEGSLPGLGWIDGEVKKLDASRLAHTPHLPHMGWNNVVPSRENGLFHKMEGEPLFYFLHSFYFAPVNDRDIIAVTEYGAKFAAAVNAGNVFGIQCHPEKSHNNGVRLLENFARF